MVKSIFIAKVKYALLAAVRELTGGFTIVLDGLKGCLEHGAEL